MTLEEAGAILREMHAEGKARRESAVSVILFGFRYAEELESLSLADVIWRAGLGNNYRAQVMHGSTLRKYLMERPSDDLSESETDSE